MSNVQTVTCSELKKWLDNDEALLIDVREIDEYKEEHIPQSTLIPLSSFEATKVPSSDKKIVFHCRSGARSLEAGKRYKQECYNLEGGILAWKKEGYATQK